MDKPTRPGDRSDSRSDRSSEGMADHVREMYRAPASSSASRGVIEFPSLDELAGKTPGRPGVQSGDGVKPADGRVVPPQQNWRREPAQKEHPHQGPRNHDQELPRPLDNSPEQQRHQRSPADKPAGSKELTDSQKQKIEDAISRLFRVPNAKHPEPGSPDKGTALPAPREQSPGVELPSPPDLPGRAAHPANPHKGDQPQQPVPQGGGHEAQPGVQRRPADGPAPPAVPGREAPDKAQPPAAPSQMDVPQGYHLAKQFKNAHTSAFGYPSDPTPGGPDGYKVHKLRSVEDVLSGKSDYASVALDADLMNKLWPVEDRDLNHAPIVVIKELDAKYASFLKARGLEHFPLVAMDTGPAVSNQTIDIRVKNDENASAFTHWHWHADIYANDQAGNVPPRKPKHPAEAPPPAHHASPHRGSPQREPAHRDVAPPKHSQQPAQMPPLRRAENSQQPEETSPPRRAVTPQQKQEVGQAAPEKLPEPLDAAPPLHTVAMEAHPRGIHSRIEETNGVQRLLPNKDSTWHYQLTGDLKAGIAAKRDVYDTDIYETTKAQVDQIKQNGGYAIGYMNLGAWQGENMGDYPDSLKLGKMEGWPEHWLDVRQVEQLRPLIKERLKLAKSKGFDAVEGDNMDAYSNNLSIGLKHPVTISQQQQIAFNKMFAEEAHKLGLAAFQKNANEIVPSLVNFFDGVITEDAFKLKGDHGAEINDYQPYTKAGKGVFDVEYGNWSYQSTAQQLGMSYIHSNKALDGTSQVGWPDAAHRGKAPAQRRVEQQLPWLDLSAINANGAK